MASSSAACAACGGPACPEFSATWGVHRCGSCKRHERSIAKSNAKTQYLLSDADLARLRCVTKPNPQHKDWAPMRTYLVSQVEEAALRKHGSLDAIVTAKQRRVVEKMENRARKRRAVQAAEEAEQLVHEAALAAASAVVARRRAGAVAEEQPDTAPVDVEEF